MLDLFSGVGGFSLGFEKAGMRTVAFCEYEKSCQDVLKKLWPDVPIFDDVRSLDAEQFRGSVDIVCGGYPCQPFSLAGKRAGKDDPRNLWPHMLRIIRSVRPRWVVAENVHGHISLGFDEVSASLENEGFTIWTSDIFSSAADLPTMERHLWIVAKANGERSQREQRQTVSRQPICKGQFPRSDKRDYERWTVPASRVCGVGEGLPRRVDRLKQLGNAVPPELPMFIGQAIMMYEKETGGVA